MATTTASPHSDSAEPRVDSLLVVLCHGLLGTAGQMAAMGGLVADALAAAVPALDVHVLCSRTNQSLWGVGLLAGGARLAREITAEAAAVWPCARTVGLVGIGHSLGGLYLRAALPHLRLAGGDAGSVDATTPNTAGTANTASATRATTMATAKAAECRGTPETPAFVPVSYVSLATPHLGSRRQGWAAAATLWAAGVAIGGSTGPDWLLLSGALETLADGAHLGALARFWRRTALGAAYGDFTVPLCTATARLTYGHPVRALLPLWPAPAAFRVLAHSGFSAAAAATIGLPPGAAQPVPTLAGELAGRTVDAAGFVCDAEGSIRTRAALVRAVCAPAVCCADPGAPFWRRVDTDFAPHMLSFVHNMGTAHLQPARDMPACTAAMALIARIVAHDCSDWLAHNQSTRH